MAVEPYDEAGIGNRDLIIRRINPVEHVVLDQNRQCLRISSKAYSPSSEPNGGMSVDIEKLILATQVDPRNYVTDPVFMGSVVFTADDIRALDLRVGYDAIPSNPCHGEVWGKARPNRFSGSQTKGLMTFAEWYVELPGVELI